MDKGILGKGNQQSIPPKRTGQKQIARTSPAKAQSTGQEKTINPIHAALTVAFNPIFDELLSWMQDVQHLTAQTRSLAANDPLRFNLEDALFAGAVIEQIQDHFTIHCDSSLMAADLYSLHKNDMHSFIRRTTHWHRLASYGLEKDLEYCVLPDVANVLPVYKNGDLIV